MKHLARKAVPAGPAAPRGSLAAALARVPDPRHPYGWRPGAEPLPLVGLLQLVVAAMLCGARSLYAVAQWGRERLEDDPALLEQLPSFSPKPRPFHFPGRVRGAPGRRPVRADGSASGGPAPASRRAA